MSDSKIVEAVGHGRLNLFAALESLVPQTNSIQPSIAKVRVQKVRDGKVYEDLTMEVKPSGFHG